MVNYGLMVGLQVHPEYLIKYQFKTWTAILNKYLKKKTDINILELGCYKGVSTVYFLKNIIGSEPTNFIDCVDTWEGSVEYDTYGEDVYKTFHKVTSMMGNFSQVGIHKMRTYNYLINYNSKKLKKDYKLYDIVFIDASHDARDVIRDLLLSWEILNVGGIIICDDYMWKKQPEDYERPKLAIDSFLYMFRDNLEVISKKYQLIFRKLKHY
jgi:predicted O-methyltransferase YrrM